MTVHADTEPAVYPVNQIVGRQQKTQGAQQGEASLLGGQDMDGGEKHQKANKAGQNADGSEVDVKKQEEIAPGHAGKGAIVALALSHGGHLPPLAGEAALLGLLR